MSNFSVEEGEKNSSRTWKHGAGRTVNHGETFLRRSQKSQWKENHTVATLWKPIRSGLDRFLPGSLQRNPFSIIRDKALKPTNRALDPSLKDFARQGLISMNLSQSTSVQFPAKKLKFSIQQISLVWTLCMVLNQSTSEREAVMYRSIPKPPMPPPGKPPGIWLFWKILVKFPAMLPV